MGRTDQVNSQEDEEFTEEVTKYPCFYGKTSEHYYDKRKVANAWKYVDEQFGFEEGNTLLTE